MSIDSKGLELVDSALIKYCDIARGFKESQIM